MFKKSIPLLWAALLGGAMFTACDEQSEVSEYAHWKERNQEVIDALADSVRQNPDEWFALKALKYLMRNASNSSAFAAVRVSTSLRSSFILLIIPNHFLFQRAKVVLSFGCYN